MNKLVKILMRRDRMTQDEAEELLQVSRGECEAYFKGDPNSRDPEQILYDEFGLEPDYVFDLIPGVF